VAESLNAGKKAEIDAGRFGNGVLSGTPYFSRSYPQSHAQNWDFDR
jgi:hypothetical protein